MKTSTYVLTHNSAPQLHAALKSLYAADSRFVDVAQAIVVDQSTLPDVQRENQTLCDKWGIKRIAHENLGASGGRWLCAKYFAESDSDLMYYFEDDLLLRSVSKSRCRFGFPSSVQNIFQTTQKLMLKEQLDYLKLTFHEVYYDHSANFVTKQAATFDKIGCEDGVACFVGNVYFSNWPMLISKSASQMLFDDDGPITEGKVALRANELIVQKELRAGVLGAWPIKHVRVEKRSGRIDLPKPT